MMMTNVDAAQFEQVVSNAGLPATRRDCEGEQHSSDTSKEEDPIYKQPKVQYNLLERIRSSGGHCDYNR